MRENLISFEKTIDNLDYCKDTYNRAFIDTAIHLKTALEHMQRRDIEIIQDKLGAKVYRASDIVENPNVTEVLRLFNQYFFNTGTFATGKNLIYVPKGETPPFVSVNEKISPSVLYEKFSSSEAYGLVSTQFLAALNIFTGGDRALSKNAVTEFFRNLSMQALNREDDTAQLSFTYLRELCDNIKNLLRSDKALMFDKTSDTFMDYSPLEFEQIKDKNQRVEENVVENIISSMRLSFSRDDRYKSFPNTP